MLSSAASLYALHTSIHCASQVSVELKIRCIISLVATVPITAGKGHAPAAPPVAQARLCQESALSDRPRGGVPLGRIALRYQRADPRNEFPAVGHCVGERVIAADEQTGGPKIVIGD
jgi:hypothetical protein